MLNTINDINKQVRYCQRKEKEVMEITQSKTQI